ncbi:MAG: voltage-gated potassium channel [Planctomycetaceae bacterium]|jgi:voltage-gated potassium channel
MTTYPKNAAGQSFRERLYIVVFEADTHAGRLFDVALIWFIIASVMSVMLGSIAAVSAKYGGILHSLEWFFTVIFSLEFIVRVWCAKKPLKYATGFFGIVDVLAILPTYISLILPGSQYLLVIRIIRVLRIFRVLKLVQFIAEAQAMIQVFKSSGRKLAVFFATVITLVIIFGSVMYIIEGEAHGFTSIPRSIYWAIVTMTTVGYGDISPETALGQAIASVVMLLGFTIIAVPTGIVTAELSRTRATHSVSQLCTVCETTDHDFDAKYCKKCGGAL